MDGSGINIMNKNKSHLFTVLLIIGIVGIMGFIFFVSRLLTDQSSPSSSIGLSTRKTKAAATSYSKFVLLNQSGTQTVASNPTATPTQIPTSPPILSPTEPEGKSGEFVAQNNTTGSSTPSPTQPNTTVSPTPSPSAGAVTTETSSPSPTTVTGLPITGNTFWSLVIFGVSGAVVFFSFLF